MRLRRLRSVEPALFVRGAFATGFAPRRASARRVDRSLCGLPGLAPARHHLRGGPDELGRPGLSAAREIELPNRNWGAVRRRPRSRSTDICNPRFCCQGTDAPSSRYTPRRIPHTTREPSVHADELAWASRRSSPGACSTPDAPPSVPLTPRRRDPDADRASTLDEEDAGSRQSAASCVRRRGPAGRSRYARADHGSNPSAQAASVEPRERSRPR
jgi:hypothetical protein